MISRILRNFTFSSRIVTPLKFLFAALVLAWVAAVLVWVFFTRL